jgi:ankyrin repeat protein
MSVNLVDEDGRTALHHAKGSVNSLLLQGADPNIADEGGWTPLMGAASAGDVVKVKELVLWQGTDVNLRNEAGCTALHYAAGKNYFDIVEAILQREDVQVNIQDKHARATPLIRAIMMGNWKVASRILKEGARTNFQDCEGNTALHYAIGMENVEMAVELIEKGALDNVRNNLGMTPMEVASSFMRNRLEEEL